MKKFDQIFFGLLIAGFSPMLLTMLTMTTWFYLDRNEAHAPYCLALGLVLGLAVDLKYFSSWLKNRYDLSFGCVMGIYLLYNLLVYGFFMGFPAFHPFAGLVAGYYYGRRVIYLNLPSNQYPVMVRKVSVFTGLVMTIICISSGIIGLAADGVDKNIQGMLHLGFEVTRPMLWAITLIGGAFLILATYFLTRISMHQTIKFASKTFLS
jgi:hypothetical protein